MNDNVKDKDENKDEHAKNPDFIVPMNLPNVKPEDYDKSIDSGGGSAKAPKGQVVNSKQNDPAREKQKEAGEMPLHEEAIGGG